ncbi:sigma-70 family RNA polymerase sigma factor [Streptomyces sp. NPDC047123]|uniref:RNA polymerase sigma factor n=1 Tax=Streptomyces sp. NPDC047123 TaxID=3155622 RepID=UPI0033CE278A
MQVEHAESVDGVTDDAVTHDAVTHDAVLCEKVRQGESRAFQVLWERHVRMARQCALRCTRGSAADADDVVSEAMLGLFQALRGGRGPVGNVAGYLRVSVRRAAARITARRQRELPVAELPERPDRGADQLCRAGARFDAACAREAFLGLSEQRRIALRLFALEDVGPGPIGERLGIASAAASSLLYRSKEALRAGFLRRHVRPASPECAAVLDRVVASLRGRPARRHAAAVSSHLHRCASCRAARRQLRDVNAGLPQRGRRTGRGR